jgi:hypothetical protein
MSEAINLLPGVPIVESPLFNTALDQMQLTSNEIRIAHELNERGYAVFDFPDPEIHERIDRIRYDMAPRFNFAQWATHGWQANVGLRVQDAWQFHKDVKAIAANPTVLALLGKLYGRRAFAFQTLNFPVGTQQHYHSDAIHFSSAPERFMCGVWLAMEDIHADAGPLVYYPGTHKWPILYNDMIGRRVGASRSRAAQEPYERVWEAMVKSAEVASELFCAKRGQALVWAANLLHGGSRQNNPQLTRWSQVTHYYFEDCSYFTPAFSDPLVGNLDLRSVRDISTGRYMPNLYVDRPIEEVLAKGRTFPASDIDEAYREIRLPADFDAQRYYELNPDVQASGVDAVTHYLIYGAKEGRRTN